VNQLTISRRLELILLVAITLIAATARFWHITVLPPGLHFDEAFENVQALSVLHGQGMPVFFEGNYGVEPTLIYLIALFYAIAGPYAIAGRLIAAAVGSATVPALHLLVRTVYRKEGRDRAVLLGLLSALTLAVLYWHVHFSRMGIEPILVPLNAILALYFLWQALETARLLPFILAGALVGFGPYTYPAGRLLPILVAAVGIHWLIANHERLASGARRVRYVRGIALAFAAAALVFAPLAVYFAHHPALLTQRISQVGVVAEGAGSESPDEAIARNMESTLKMYSVEGDRDPRNNLPGRPVVDLLWALFFFVGLAACLTRALRPPYGMVLWWLVIMSIPTMLSEYAPHFRRALGASPAVALALGLGVLTLLEWLIPNPPSEEERPPDGVPEGVMWETLGKPAPLDPLAGIRPYAVAGFIGFIWLLGAASSLYDYFAVWSSDPALYYAFDVGLRDIGEYVHELPPDELAYLSPVRQDHQTLIFTVGAEFRPKTFDGRHVLVLPPPDHAATYINLVAEDLVSPRALSAHLPDLTETQRFRDAEGAVYAIARHVPAMHPEIIGPALPLTATLADYIAIAGLDVPAGPVRAGDTFIVTIYWRAAAPLDRDYTASVQLIGPLNPATNSLLWAQEDVQPGKGTYPTTRWTPGETIIESYTLQIPADAPHGRYTLQAGMYWLPTLEPLGSTVSLTEIELQP